MLTFISYAFRETGANLWRNRLMTFAAVLTVAVSLALVGGSLLLKQSASQASIVWQQQTRVTIWMKPDATSAEIDAVKNQLATLPYIHGTCQYWNKQKNYAEARRLLTPVQFSYLSVDNMPTSFLCEPAVPADVSVIASTFTGQPGVFQVTGPYKQVRQMEHAITVIQWVLFGLAAVLLVSALVLILNTIRLAIFSRRREVSVMKLVGATNWFIRVPFITEGFIQGLVGSAIAVLGVSALYIWYPLGQAFQLPVSDLIGTNIVVVLFGVTVGSLGSGFAIRRFLDV